MSCHIRAIGRTHEQWLQSALQHYIKRFPTTYRPHISDITTPRRCHSRTLSQCQNDEHRFLTHNLPSGFCIVALDEKGQSYSSTAFADQLGRWYQQYRGVVFLLGGPDGLTNATKSHAMHLLSLSSLTFTHSCARLLLIEQLYRAYTINKNHPYHR